MVTIHEALEELENQEDIGSYLISQGFPNTRDQSQNIISSCPVARFLQQRTEEEIQVGINRVFIGDKTISFSRRLTAFIAKWDAERK